MHKIFTFFLILFIYMIVLIGFALKNDADCLNQGYPRSNTTYNFDGFCIKTFGQITEVNPVKGE